MTRLKQLRVHCRLTRDELSARAEVGVRTIQRLEDGASGAHDATLFKLADALTALLRVADSEAQPVDPYELLRDAFDSDTTERSAA